MIRWNRMCLSIAIVPVIAGSAGCRCDGRPSEDALPPTQISPAASQAVASTGACPPRPAWAGDRIENVEVELLHARMQGEKEYGAGYRLHADGSFETYDTVAVAPDDTGRMVLKTVEGSWKSQGKVKPDAVAALRTAIAEQQPGVLQGKWRTTGSTTTRTHLLTRREGKLVELCYLGTEGPKPMQPVEKKIHDLMGQLEGAKN